MAATIWVNRHNLTETIMHEAALPALDDGSIRLKIQSFSVTANNVTYAVVGDAFGYWQFFPADGDWGVVPVWGHATVTESRNSAIAVGERLYGYLPMGTHLDITPGKISDLSLFDVGAHRQSLSPIYNQYSRLAADPEHNPAQEAERELYAPLFKTGFLIEAMLRREDWFGAQNLILTSASSKTALGLASVAKDLSPSITRIGLTSTGNIDFVRTSGLYDAVYAYNDIAALTAAPSVSVDFAGNSAVLRTVHEHHGDALKYSCLVGATHTDARGLGGTVALPGPKPILFFAPDHAVATVKELGPKGFGEAVAARFKSFLGVLNGKVRIEKRSGIASAAAAFADTLGGKADPAVGIIVRPQADA
jgi:Protein of unknown function (DUF2855)